MGQVALIESSSINTVFDGDNQFSDGIIISGPFNLVIQPLTHEGGSPLAAFDGTVSVERMFNDTCTDFPTHIPPGEEAIWGLVATFTSEFAGTDNQPTAAVYRVGIKTGEHTAGKVLVRIGK